MNIPINPNINTNGIHNGDVTHNQDQVATTPISDNLRNKNTMNINELKPTLVSTDFFL